MLDQFWSSLKSGTDIRGVASEGGGYEINLTDDVVKRICKGFAIWLEQKFHMSSDCLVVAVGHDSRISAGRISNAAMTALSETGARVLDCGLASTPSMFFAIEEFGCQGAIEITASHHPFYRNGLKFFTKYGGLDSKDITEILQYAQENKTPLKKEGIVEKSDSMDRYCHRLQRMILEGVGAKEGELPLTGFHIVVDAGNGAGGFYAHRVLKPLGADITGSQFLEPDGMFPNHIPNPEDKNAMESVCKATVKAKADLGVIFDTDVDRGGAVDSTGAEINRNRLVALASAIALEQCPGGTVVTDSITSSGLKVFIEQHLGGKHHRFKRGYKNVINESIRLNEQGISSPLAIETSGHAAFRENQFLDDGAYLVTKIVIQMVNLKKEGKQLQDLLQSLQEPIETVELRLPITETDFCSCGNRIIQQLNTFAEKKAHWQIAPDNHEGIRCSFDKGNGDGWFLLRLSVHDPLMPLNIESNQTGGTKLIAQELECFFEQCQGLDITSIKEFIK